MAILKVKVLDWNVAGAKFLKSKATVRERFKSDVNQKLHDLAKTRKPDVILLQEVVRYQTGDGIEDLIEPPSGYHYKASLAIDTQRQCHPTKWMPFRQEGGWSADAYLAQGYGLLWREEIEHCPIWDIAGAKTGADIQTEAIHLETGLYTGDRNTEPRLAVVAHFVLKKGEVPLDIFLVNLHLTTLKGEREGLPEQDDAGSNIRLAQIGTVLNGIVSRYNDWHNRTCNGRGRPDPVWILAGDFNCTPDSPEIKKLERMNFLDVIPHKGTGTKARGLRPTEATITLDYIFAGPKYVALDPYIAERGIQVNPKPMYDIAISDHFPLFAEVPIRIPMESD